MIHNSPVISVIMPAYNHDRFISQTIESVLKQTFRDLELLVIDDGSRDDTLKIANDYAKKDDRIKVYSKLNGGAHSAINFGLKESKGEWISIINSDDLYSVNRIENLYNRTKYSESVLYFTAYKFIDDAGNEVKNTEILGDLFSLRAELDTENYDIYSAIIQKNITLSTGNLFFLKKLVNFSGYFDDLKYCHDWKFVLKALKYTSLEFLNTEDYFYRIHKNNSFASLNHVAEIETRECLNEILLSSDEIAHPHYPTLQNLFSKKQNRLADFIMRMQSTES